MEIGSTVGYKGKVYKLVSWSHYRLEWYEAELRDHNGSINVLVKERQLLKL